MGEHGGLVVALVSALLPAQDEHKLFQDKSFSSCLLSNNISSYDTQESCHMA
jgi:hypothetical protein